MDYIEALEKTIEWYEDLIEEPEAYKKIVYGYIASCTFCTASGYTFASSNTDCFECPLREINPMAYYPCWTESVSMLASAWTPARIRSCAEERYMEVLWACREML